MLRHVQFMASGNSCDLLNTSKSEHFQAVSNGVSQDHVIASTLAPAGNVTPARNCTKCCPRRGRRMKVAPTDLEGVNLVEVRPGRCLHICHVNSHPPDTTIQTQPRLPQCPPSGGIRKSRRVDVLQGVGDNAGENRGSISDDLPNIVPHYSSPHKPTHSDHSNGQHQTSPLHNSEGGNQLGLTRQPHPVAISDDIANIASSPLYTGGTQNSDVIFFIHGVGGSSAVWKSQIDYFGAAGYEVIAPDLIGHGLSCAPREKKAYTFREILLDIYVIFDTYCRQSNVVVGHSYGSSFAAVLARERPQRVSRLVMISGGAPIPLGPQQGIFSMPECFLSCCQPLMLRTFRKNAFHKESKTCIPQEHAFDVPSYVLKHTMNGQEWPQGDAAYHEAIDTLTLLIHGRDDHLVSVEEEQAMVEAIAASEMVVLDGASHMVMLERTREVNHIIRNFITTGIPLVTEESTRWPVDISHCDSPDVTYEGVHVTMKTGN